jgi:hypothetical protein
MSERSFRRDRERRIDAAKRREALRARKAAAAAALTGAFVLGAPAASSAATFVVNQTDDGPIGTTTCDPTDVTVACNLRDAVAGAAASAGADDITFDSNITGSTITLNSGPIYVNDNDPLSIYGGATPDSIYVDGDYSSMVFDVSNTYDGPDPGLTMTGMTIQHGSGLEAGGIFVDSGSDAALADSTVTGNVATGERVDKYAWVGGGGISNLGTMRIQDSTISDNYADTYVADSPPFIPYGGGGGIDNVGDLTISGSTIDNNGSAYFGGGIFEGISKYPSSLDISNTTISNNGAPYGGGIATYAFFGGNPGSSHSVLRDSTVTGNDAFDGGGLDFKYLSGSHHWLISHSTLSDNYAVDDGGGIHFDVVPGTFELLDSTVSGNGAGNYGGGAYISSDAQKYQDGLQFNNSTIASNYASTDGGGLYLDYTDPDYAGANVPLFSTIVGNNTNSGGLNDLAQATDSSNPSGGGFDLSFSLVRAPGNAAFTETPAGSNIIGADPQLGALGSNGGPTETQLPSINSPVVDKGSAPGNLTTDQRGDPRTVDTSVANADDGTDIGSVELAVGPPGPPGPPPAGQTKVGTLKKKHKKRKRVIRTKHEFAKIRLTFRASVPGVSFRCSVDGGAFEPCQSPFVTKVKSGPGKGKVHRITIQAVDSAGNPVANPRVFRFRVILED